jgi:hypothetical protein
MPIHHRLDRRQHLVYIGVAGETTVREAIRSLRQASRKTPLPVSCKLLLDLSQAGEIPASLPELKRLARMVSRRLPVYGGGPAAVVATDERTADLVRILYHRSGSRRDVRYFASLEEGLEWLSVEMPTEPPGR